MTLMHMVSFQSFDNVIKIISCTGVVVSGSSSSSVRGLRTLRVMRPLRLLSKVGPMRKVIEAFVRSIPGLVNVSIILLLLWLIFRFILSNELFSFSPHAITFVQTAFLACSSLAGSLRVATTTFSTRCHHWMSPTKRTVWTCHSTGTSRAPTLTMLLLALCRCCRFVLFALCYSFQF